MDTVTHALVGAALAQAAAPPRAALAARERLWLGALGGAFPDADFAAFPFDPLRFLADWHQGPTHSIVLLPLWAALIGAAFALAAGKRKALLPASFAAGLGLASHIATDAITAYGVALFHPLSDLRFAAGIAFVLDPIFSAIALIAFRAAWRDRRIAASAALAALSAYVASLALLQQQALALARAAQAALAFEQVSAYAQPFSPFHWRLVAVAGDRYYVAHVNLAGHRPMPLPGALGAIAAAYRPPGELVWTVRERWGADPAQRALARERWNDPRFAPYRRFAAHPAVSRVDEDGAWPCVWFTDLRYDLPALPDTFRYGFCREREAEDWNLYRLRYFSADARQRLDRR
ncbi:MAG: metal-dependent hydrolase [Burkholderiales bacterium]|nr:metal-dependent hydrolase [Burkholderiales bacterium]